MVMHTAFKFEKQISSLHFGRETIFHRHSIILRLLFKKYVFGFGSARSLSKSETHCSLGILYNKTLGVCCLIIKVNFDRRKFNFVALKWRHTTETNQCLVTSFALKIRGLILQIIINLTSSLRSQLQFHAMKDHFKI